MEGESTESGRPFRPFAGRRERSASRLPHPAVPKAPPASRRPGERRTGFPLARQLDHQGEGDLLHTAK